MRILLTVCGSISAYKSYDIVRSLVNSSHQVRVILTRGALEFIKPQTFRYLGAESVYSHDDDFNYPKLNTEENVLHVELARWCERLIIAPATANTLANLAMAKANDLLSSVFLAIEPYKPILIFPAMNTQMLNHTLVQENMGVLERLKKVDQLQIMKTKSGNLACGEVGDGKLLDVEVICDLISTSSTVNNNQKHFLITTGATVAPLDSVRYLTNPSSGHTGYVIAKEALARGHKVTVLAGIYATNNLNNLIDHKDYSLTRVTTTDSMLTEVNRAIANCDCYISAAAIGDIEFEVSNTKIKKDQLLNSIPIKKSQDILKSVVKNYSNKFIIGFAAESELSESILQTKWNAKPVNILVGTKVSNGLESGTLEGFNVPQASYAILKNKIFTYQENWNKEDLANYLVDQVEQANVN